MRAPLTMMTEYSSASFSVPSVLMGLNPLYSPSDVMVPSIWTVPLTVRVTPRSTLTVLELGITSVTPSLTSTSALRTTAPSVAVSLVMVTVSPLSALSRAV